MSEGGAQTGSNSRFLRALPPGLKWLLKVLIGFPVPNFFFILGGGLGLGEIWYSGEWANCGGRVLQWYLGTSVLIIVPAVFAVFAPKVRKPLVRTLIIWTAANAVLPLWANYPIELVCGPRPWL